MVENGMREFLARLHHHRPGALAGLNLKRLVVELVKNDDYLAEPPIVLKDELERIII